MIAFACGVIELPTPIPLASDSTRCPISLTAGASSRLHRDKAIGDHSAEKQRDPRALGEIAPFLRPHDILSNSPAPVC